MATGCGGSRLWWSYWCEPATRWTGGRRNGSKKLTMFDESFWFAFFSAKKNPGSSFESTVWDSDICEQNDEGGKVKLHEMHMSRQDHGFGAVVICGLCGFGDKWAAQGLNFLPRFWRWGWHSLYNQHINISLYTYICIIYNLYIYIYCMLYIVSLYRYVPYTCESQKSCTFSSPRFWRDGLWQFAPLLLGETHTGFHASEVPFQHIVDWWKISQSYWEGNWIGWVGLGFFDLAWLAFYIQHHSTLLMQAFGKPPVPNRVSDASFWDSQMCVSTWWQY